MNNIFLKNLKALNEKNSELARTLEAYIPSDIPQIFQENGAYNLIYKGKSIHNKLNPLAEAQEIFSLAENSPVAIHLVYGLGLGYLFQVASLQSEGTVVLYEPDLNILWIAFTLVDFSSDILKENVFVCNTFETVSEAIYKKSGMKNTPQMLSIPSQREYNPEEFDELVLKLKNLVGSFSLDLKYTTQKIYSNLLTLIENIPYLLQESPLLEFKDVYKGKTAVVVSAGPTLDRNIEHLKINREKYILFVVGTAAKTLFSNGIKPDFIVIIESYNSIRQLEGLDLEGVNLISEPYSHKAIREFNFSHRFSHISANTPVNHLWAELCGINIEEYWSKGTVSYTALNCARLLGCSKIILVGQDLAYLEGQCYSKDSVYKDLVCGVNPETGRWEIMAKDFAKFADAISTEDDVNVRAGIAWNRLKNLNASLHFVKGINGDMIPTESVYAAFVEPLQNYVEHFNDRNYINTSLLGAQINGFKNMALDEALADSEPVKRFKLDTSFEYDREKIFLVLDENLDELKQILKTINDGQAILKNLKNDLRRRRNVDSEILVLLKKLTLIYIELSTDFAEKSKMFDFITVANKIDLDYEMKMTQTFTTDSVMNIIQKIQQYFENADSRIKEVLNLSREVLNENFNSKS